VLTLSTSQSGLGDRYWSNQSGGTDRRDHVIKSWQVELSEIAYWIYAIGFCTPSRYAHY
jgi:hypothetical protein